MSKQSKTSPTTYIKLSELVPWSGNYNEGDVGAIAQSIERFGFNSAIRVWKDNVIIGGNHTAMALMSLKARGPLEPHMLGQLAWPPTHIIESGGDWLVPCVDISHLDELDARAFAIADNDLARKAVQDAHKKAQYLIELQQQRPESLRAAGMSVDELDDFLKDLSTDYDNESVDPFDVADLDDAYVPDASGMPPDTFIVYVSFDNREEFEEFLTIVDPRRSVDLAKQFAAVRAEDVMPWLRGEMPDVDPVRGTDL